MDSYVQRVSPRNLLTQSNSVGEKQKASPAESPADNLNGLRVSVASTSTDYKLSRVDQARLASCALLYATLDIPNLTARGGMLTQSRRRKSAAALTLVMDLDETCVRSMINYAVKPAAADTLHATVFYRPFLQTMLRAFRSLNVEVLVFTASHQSYSDSVLDVIDPDGDFIVERYYRQHTVPHPAKPNVLCKDLSSLGRNLNRCLLIDDLPDSSAHNPLNAWPIMPYSKALRCGAVNNVVGRRHHEARFRKFCAPVLLTPSLPGLPRTVMGVQQPDYALLNLFALIKLLLSSGCDVPAFTQYHKNDISTALVTDTTRMWLPTNQISP